MKIIGLLAALGLAGCVTTGAEAKKETVQIPQVIYIGHFGCIEKDVINEEISYALGKNCAQYNAEAYIFQDKLSGAPCGNNGLKVTITYKCVPKPKQQIK